MINQNISIPEFYCLARKEFFYDHKKNFGQYIPVIVFGVRSKAGRNLDFHVVTNSGMQFWGVPSQALCWKNCERMPLEDTQLWDCFGDEVSVVKFNYLAGLACSVKLESGTIKKGSYLMTFDWNDNAFSDEPSQRKNGHLIKLEDGNFTIQPNNRILWKDPSFTTETPELDWPVHTTTYQSEHFHKKSKGDKFHY